jgi:hypothetical protein
MKMSLSCEQKHDILMSLLMDDQLDDYAEMCKNAEDAQWPNTPAECEDEDCTCCPLDLAGQRKIDCPYVQKGWKFEDGYCPACGEAFTKSDYLQQVTCPDEETIIYEYECKCGLEIHETHESTGFEVQ